jgi:hypothetical protein
MHSTAVKMNTLNGENKSSFLYDDETYVNHKHFLPNT